MTATSAECSAIDIPDAVKLLEPLTDLVARACVAILAVKRQGVSVTDKSDGSPVTQADLASDQIIRKGLQSLVPLIPAVSEECLGGLSRPVQGSFFLIDPLDGTREFIAGRDEFTVNLALVHEGAPVLGIVAAPALGVIWRGVVGHGAQRLVLQPNGQAGQAEAIQTRALARAAPGKSVPWIVAVSRSHPDASTQAFIDARPGAIRQSLGSAVKFGRVAEGKVDIYPRLAPTCEWDVAAGHALVTAAGGRVTDHSGAPVRFGGLREGFIVPNFIVWGDNSAAEDHDQH